MLNLEGKQFDISLLSSIFVMKLLGVADRFFYDSFFLSVSKTECSIKIMMTVLYLHGNLLGSFIYFWFLFGLVDFFFLKTKPYFIALTGLVLLKLYWP